MSNFIVSARKYRPARFDDVVGQSHVSQTLKNALRNNQVAHAFLFCGPRGVGKTTNARILAKILNCTNRTPDFEACNTCDSCKAFNQNASFNIFELDAASNNSVESIRSLVEQTRIPPQQGQYKVFIIDEVHMLSQAAFNAFLKTLEEPPPHAIFILATTEKFKIIPTILSRCQIFDFRRIQVPDIVAHLQKICDAENIKADNDALYIIAQKADGSLRDALSIFDRLSSVSDDKKILYADVVENLNLLDYDYFFKITDALLSEDLPTVLNVFDDILKKGFEGDIFINGLAEHFRQLLVVKDSQTMQLLEGGAALKKRYTQQAELTPVSFLLTALNLCNECDINYKQARQKRLHVEMALIKMLYINRVVDGSKEGNDIKKSEPAKQKNTPTLAAENPPIYNSPITPKTVNATTRQEKKGNAPENNVGSAPSQDEGLKPAATISTMPISVLSSSRIGSIEAIAAMIEEEERLIANTVSRLNVENLRETWNKYAESHESPSTKAAMLNAELVLEDKKVIARTGTELYKGMIVSESRLSDFLRFDLSEPGLLLEVQINIALAPQVENEPISQIRKYLSPREKLKLMMKVNPLVKDLAFRLDLKPDEG